MFGLDRVIKPVDGLLVSLFIVGKGSILDATIGCTEITEQVSKVILQVGGNTIPKDFFRYMVAIVDVPSAIYHFDITGKILYLNKVGANQIGYATTEEVLAEKDVMQLRKRAYETFTVLNEEVKPMPADQNSTALTFKTGKSSEVVSQLIHKQTGASH